MAARLRVSDPCFNGMEAPPSDEEGRLYGERSPCTGSGPELGCGMKQACKPWRGENRREAANA